jgi:hypothetical protein
MHSPLGMMDRLSPRARRAAALVLGACLVIATGVAVWALVDSGPSGNGDADQVAGQPSPGGEPIAPGDEVENTPDTTVPAGDGDGSIDETVEVDPDAVAAVADPVAIDGTADFGNGVSARLTEVTAVEAEAHLPGEFSGPAVALTIEVSNGSEESISLATVTADLTFDGLSAYPVLDPERPQFSGELAPGDTTSGSYVFTLDPAQRDDVALRLSYSTEAPTVIFAGSVADD